MAQPAGLARLTWQFGLLDAGVQQDIAEFGIVFRPTVAPSAAEYDAALVELATQGYKYWDAAFSADLFYTSCQLNTVTATIENGAGLTLAKQVAVNGGGTPWHGTGTGGSLPWQVSMVLGIYSYTPGTFIPAARRRRGRIYLPPMVTSVLADADSGTLTQAFCDDRLTNLTNMLKGIENFAYTSVAGLAPVPGVLSRAAAQFYPMTDGRTDTVLDTQRRRTNSLQASIRTKQYVP